MGYRKADCGSLIRKNFPMMSSLERFRQRTFISGGKLEQMTSKIPANLKIPLFVKIFQKR